MYKPIIGSESKINCGNASFSIETTLTAVYNGVCSKNFMDLLSTYYEKIEELKVILANIDEKENTNEHA